MLILGDSYQKWDISHKLDNGREKYMKFKHQSELIKKAKKELRLTQKDIADAAGVHMQGVSNAERGLCNITIKIARGLNKLGVSWKRIQLAALCDYRDSWKREYFSKTVSKK